VDEAAYREWQRALEEALSGVREKLRRAEHHLETLQVEWRKHPGPDLSPYRFTIHIKPDTGDHFIHAEFVKPPPLLLSVIVGDVLHNLRSALDHLAWEMVKRAGGKPGRHTYFPICDTEGEWRSRVEQRRRSDDPPSPLTGIDPESPIWAFIQGVQPYKGAVHANALTQLRILSNADKHRSLLISGVFPDPNDFAAMIQWNPDAVLRRQEILLKAEEPLENGAKVAALNFDPAKADPEVRVEGELASDIAFSDGNWKGTRAGLADLKAALFQYVEYATALWLEPPQLEDPAQLADLMAWERASTENDQV
jgi:hypothetical protein